MKAYFIAKNEKGKQALVQMQTTKSKGTIAERLALMAVKFDTSLISEEPYKIRFYHKMLDNMPSIEVYKQEMKHSLNRLILLNYDVTLDDVEIQIE